MQENVRGQDAVFDLLVVGAGPTGLATAIEAKKAGFRVVLADKGCVCNSLFHYPAHMTFFTTSELLEIGGIPFPSPNAKPTRNEALEYYRQVAALLPTRHSPVPPRGAGQRRRWRFCGADHRSLWTPRGTEVAQARSFHWLLRSAQLDGHSRRNPEQGAPLLPRSPSLLRHGRGCGRWQEFGGHCRTRVVASRRAGHAHSSRRRACSLT